MIPLKAEEIYGTWATLLLPVREDESIDYALLEDEIEHLLQSGVNGIYTNGTAGEFYNQTEYEFDQLHDLLSRKCEEAQVPFQIGCGHMSPVISLERVKRAKSWKPSAIQVILPDWNPPSSKETLIFLEKLAAWADPVGLVLYNPPHAKRVLLPQDFEKILDAGIPLVGCKVAGGDDNWYKAMNGVLGKISVFVAGHKLATGIRQGAHGSYSNVACLNPTAAQLWYGMMLKNADAAVSMEKRIQSFFQDSILPYITDLGYSNTAVDKFLARIGGWCRIETRLKWPYRGIRESDVDKVKKEAKEIIPEFIL